MYNYGLSYILRQLHIFTFNSAIRFIRCTCLSDNQQQHKCPSCESPSRGQEALQ
jgi:hypothetical protein